MHTRESFPPRQKTGCGMAFFCCIDIPGNSAIDSKIWMISTPFFTPFSALSYPTQ